MIKYLIVVIFRLRCKADEGGSGGNLRNFQRLVEPGTSEPLGRPGSTRHAWSYYWWGPSKLRDKVLLPKKRRISGTFQRLVEPGTSEPLGRPGSTEDTMRGGLLSQLFSRIKGPVNLYPFCQTLAQSQPYFLFHKIYPLLHSIVFSSLIHY